MLRGWVQTQVVDEDLLAHRIDPSRPVCYVLQIRQLSALVVVEEEARRLGLHSPMAPMRAADAHAVSHGVEQTDMAADVVANHASASASGATAGATGDATSPAPAQAPRAAASDAGAPQPDALYAPPRRLGAGGPIDGDEPHSFFFLTRSGQPSPLSSVPYRYAPRLARLVARVRADPGFDVQLVPTHVFWGREPERQDSILKALFAEGWGIPGVLRQALRVLIHGRATLLRFGEPLSLRALMDGATDEPLALRRAARLLRVEFRRERERVVGPNLSHRYTLINSVIESEPVRKAIDAEAVRRSIDRDRAEAAARRAAWEIAANMSYGLIRAFELGLKLLWNRLYDGVLAHRMDELRAVAAGSTLVYLPCHRSHIDYLLLSFLIFQQGMPPPHVAAGANLNLPLVGSLLRRGGAFFLRRSFRDDPLYGAVFAEYLHAMINRGHSTEYFVEGGRSRTGRMLQPKAGLLAMTVESWQRTPGRSLVLVPVYIGYERLLEGDTYLAELSGRPKQKESLLGLVRSLRVLREHFGAVHVNIGEPLRIDEHLRRHGIAPGVAVDDAQLRPAISALALEVVRRINDAVVLNPVNLLSIALLGAPRHAMDARAREQALEMLQQLMRRAPYSARQVVADEPPATMIADAERNGVIARITHPLGDVLHVPVAQAPLLAYFRNNVLHAFALPALLACALTQNERFEASRLRDLAQRMLPFLRAELFVSWTAESLPARVDDVVAAFGALGLVRGDLPLLSAPPVGTAGSVSLHALAQSMRQPLERYFIVLAVLGRQGSGATSARELEDLCYLLAQRMALLHEAPSPEFFDRSAFRALIDTLIDLGWVRVENERLTFGEAVEAAAADASWLLSNEVRRAIAQVVAPAESAQPASAV